MSFNHYARKVRDPNVSIWIRLSALRSCIRKLSSLTNESFSVAVERFNKRFDFNRSIKESSEYPPVESHLLAALAEIETERNLLIEHIQINAQYQKIEKKRKREQSSNH
jgi:hypothetical protein